MQLYSIRGGNIKDLEDKKYTIGIGISLGNKWFSVANIIGLIEWSLIYSKDKIIVYVADSIHAINVEVRNKITYEKALAKVDKQGSKILESVKNEVLNKFSNEENKRIIYVKWNEIADEKYTQKVDYLKSLYRNNSDFKNSILSIIKDFILKEKREFSEAEITRLGEYIVEELPELVNQVSMGGVICEAYTYPFDAAPAVLAEKIQNGEVFPEIKEKIMDSKPKVFLEVR